MPRAFYDPSDVMVKNQYAVAATNNQFFIPGNNQAYGDNPDAGTMAQRLACNKKVIGATPTGVVPSTNEITYTDKGEEL